MLAVAGVMLILALALVSGYLHFQQLVFCLGAVAFSACVGYTVDLNLGIGLTLLLSGLIALVAGLIERK